MADFSDCGHTVAEFLGIINSKVNNSVAAIDFAIGESVDEHNESETAHSDIREMIGAIQAGSQFWQSD